MSLESGIYGLLVANTSLTAIVGTRIYQYSIPTNGTTFPCIVFSILPQKRVNTIDGLLPRYNVDVQVDCLSQSSMSQALSIKNQVISTLTDYQGDLGGLNCIRLYLDQEHNTTEPPKTGDPNFLRRRTIIFNARLSEQ